MDSNTISINLDEYQFLSNETPDLKEQIKKYIILGYHVHNSIQFSPESNSEIFKSLTGNLSVLKESIDRFQGKSINSTLKGKEMEDIVESVITTNFPDYTVECTAKKAYESDFCIHMDNCVTGLIEVKCYNESVNQKEIDKFIRDLTLSKYKFGIFASVTSGIVNKHRLSIEYINKNEQIIIYVPNINKEYSKLIWAIVLVEQLLKIKDKNRINYIDTNNILNIIDNYRETYSSVSKMSYSINEAKQRIIVELDNLTKQSIELEYSTNNLLNDACKKINVILDELNCDYIPLNENEILDTCEYYKNLNYKSYIQLKELLENINKNKKLGIFKNESNKLIILSNKDKSTIAEIKILKTNIKIKFNKRNIEIEWCSQNIILIESLLTV